ncbi:MAG: hypothetical protein WBQ18_04710 [Solirubrobacteraceae bacterium]
MTGLRTRLFALACVFVIALMLAGCGGSGSGSSGANDAAKIKQTVHQALADLASADGQGFCSLASAAGQRKLAHTLPGYSCPRIVELISRHLPASAKTGLLHANVRDVTIKGSVATVKASDIVASQGTLKGFLEANGKPTRLVHEPDGSWKIDA